MPDNALPQPTELPWLQEIQPLLAKAEQGDVSVLPELRAFLDTRPEVWQSVGDLAKHAEQSLLNLITGTDLFGQESIRRKLAEIKAEVGGPSPPPLEKLLTERIAICWLGVHQAEMEMADLRQRTPANTALADQARKRLDSANKRYLYSIKQLAVVRKLLKPALSPLQLAGLSVNESCPGPGKRPSRTRAECRHPVLN